MRSSSAAAVSTVSAASGMDNPNATHPAYLRTTLCITDPQDTDTAAQECALGNLQTSFVIRIASQNRPPLQAIGAHL